MNKKSVILFCKFWPALVVLVAVFELVFVSFTKAAAAELPRMLDLVQNVSNLKVGSNNIMLASAYPEGYPMVFVNGQFNSSSRYELTNGDPAHVTIKSSYPEIHFTTNGLPADILSDLYTGEFLILPGVVINAVAYSADYSDEVSADPVTTALIPTFALTNNTFGGGSAIFDPSGGSYLSDTEVKASATNLPGWTFERWEEDGVITSFDSNTVVRMDRSKAIRAVFGTELRITATGGSASGEVTQSPQISYHDYGSTGVVSATPAAGKYFIRWNLSSFPGVITFTNNPLSITITNTNALASAIFGPLPAGNHALTVLVHGLGTVERSSSLLYYPDGTHVVLTPKAAPGSQFVNWTGALDLTANPLEVVVDGQQVITANFTQTPSISIAEPLEGALLNGAISNLISTVSADADGSVDRVEFYVNGDFIGSSQTPFSLSWQPNLEDSVELTAVAIDNSGARATSAPVHVEVILPPRITLQPLTQSVPRIPVAPFQFSVDVDGNDLVYQWQHNGTNIPNEIYSDLQLGRVTEDANGTYQLFVTNEVGTAVSDLVTLTVVPPGAELGRFPVNGTLSAPAVGPDGSMYVAQQDRIRAFRADGTERWAFGTGLNFSLISPTISSDGTIYFGSQQGRFFAVAGDSGLEKWHFDLNGLIRTEAAIGLDGTIFIGATNSASALYALNPDGTKRWSFDTDGGASAAAVDMLGDIYFSSEKTVYALSQNGALKWKKSATNQELQTPLIGSQNLILVPRGHDLWALDSTTGTERWSFPALSPNHSSVGADGTIYAGGSEPTLYAINPQTGIEQWRASLGAPLASAPVAAANGFIYAMTYGGVATTKLITLDATGREVRRLDLSGHDNLVPTQVVLTFENLLYFGVADSSGSGATQSISVQVADAPPADSPWPMFRKTAGNHGNAAGIPGDFRFQTLTDYNPTASAAVDASGTIWTAFDGRLQEFIGSTNKFDDSQSLDDTPVVGPSGRIFTATLTEYYPPVTTLAIFDPKLNAYVASATVPGGPAPLATLALALDETVYLGASTDTNGTLYSWKEGHDPVAITNFPGTINIAPVIDSEGSILVCVSEVQNGFNNGALYKVRPDGTIVGKFSVTQLENGNVIFGGPIIGGDGTIYICDLPSSIFALTPDLHLKWQLTDPNRLGYLIDSSPAIGPDGTLYVAVDVNTFQLFAINPDGTLKWTAPFEMPEGQSSYSSIAVGEDKTVYLGGGQYFFAIRDAGDHAVLGWKLPLPGQVRSSPLLAPDGNLYLNCDGGTFLSLKGSSGPANSPWPMYRGNAQRTANAGPPNRPPSIVITRPTAGSILTDATNVVIEVNAGDDSGPVAKVEFFDAGNLIAASTTPPFAVAIQFSAGSHSLTAKATDQSGAMTISGVVNFTVRAATTFRWVKADYSASESDATVQLTIQKAGPDPGRVNFATRAISAEEGRDFLAASGAVDFGAGASSQTITVSLLNDYVPDGTRQFEVDLTASSADSLVVTPAIATVTITDDDAALEHNSLLEFGFPSDRPVTRGRLQVYLEPVLAAGQWRFPWELLWRNSGDIASDLDPGEYPVEFRPVAGYAAPDASTESVPGGITVVRTNVYTANPALTGGTLTVLFNPLDLLGGASVPGWRFLGETNYHLHNERVANIPAGVQVIEFRPVAGWDRPTSRGVLIQSDVEATLNIGYVLDAPPAIGIATPTPFPSYAAIRDGLLSTPRQPSPLVGQLRTVAGYGSGIAVRERVVLTAAHVLFDDSTLDFVPSVDWFPARQAGEYEPRSIAASGWYVPTNYVTQRRHERIDLGLAPGISTPASQQWDVAAIYFEEPAARGGFSGYLLSDNDTNEWLISSRQKELFGYPLSGAADGRMHYILPGNYTFTSDAGRIFSTAQFLSYPGNSGGPLCVQFTRTDGQIIYFPAAVYLGNRENRSIVRAIDSDTALLINLAASSGAIGTNFLGEGVVGLNAGSGLGGLQLVHLTVQLTPAAAVTAGAGWRLQGAATYLTNGASITVPVGDVHLEFNPVSGYTTPAPRTITLVANQSFTLPISYVASSTLNQARFTGFERVGNILKLRARRANAGSLILESSSDLIHWGTLRTIDLAADVDTDFEITITTDRADFLRLRNP